MSGNLNSVDPDETPHSVASHLGQHCLLKPVCPNTYDEYDACNHFDLKVPKILICFSWND